MLDTMKIRLADGTDWEFVGPEAFLTKGPAARAEWFGLLTAIAEAQDEPERQLGELALAIFLLGIECDLSPDEYNRLLCFPPGHPGAETLRARFRALALLHAKAAKPRGEDVLNPPGHFRWPGFGFSRGKSRWMSHGRQPEVPVRSGIGSR